MKKFFTLFCTFFSLSFAFSQSILYVDSSVTASGYGSSWATAVKTLGEALDAASADSTIQQIWMAKGTYYPDEGNGRTDNDRNLSFSLKNGLAIYGGFAGGETSLNQRNWKTNATILSGDIDQVAGNDGNAYHVVYNNNNYNNRLNNTAILDGFTITGGNANGGNYASDGGGMYNYNSSPSLVNCNFSSNTAASNGGGMFNISSSPSLINCSFSSNTNRFNGGGMYNFYSSPSLINSNFSLNTTATKGGGIFNDFSSPSLVNCTFSLNTAEYGGGMYNNISSSASLVNCSFSSNTAASNGGGMFNESSSPSLSNCILWNNTSSQIYNYFSSTPTVSYSIVQGGYSGEGNLDADPQFVNASNPAGADGILGTVDDGLRLQQGSPAINKGNNAAVPATVITDITGALRIQQGTVDMGAYEYKVITGPIVRVDSGVTASGDGSSWATAVKTLSEALDAANTDSTIHQIWVAKGTYYPDEGPGRTDNNRNLSFSMKNGVAIYGGFAGGETSLDQRNWKTNVTVLSGDIDQVTGNSGNAYHVVYNNNNGLNNTALLDGFTLTGGNAYPDHGGNISGGGMYNYSSSPSIVNCSFSQNTAYEGGGMHNERSSPSIVNCSFSSNNATYGGGIYNVISSSRLVNCSFSVNSASGGGGGIYNLSSSPKIVNCSFTSNTAANGGGIANVYSSPSLINCILWSNTKSQIENYNSSTPTVSYSIVQGGYSGEDNLDADPSFVNASNPAGADGVFGTADDGLQLRCNSPAINKGDNNALSGITIDITGASRIQHSVVDIGAYESPYDTPLTPSVTIATNPGDTICAGTPITFTTTPVNGGTKPVYQWKKNDVVVGTDSSAYTTNELMDGDIVSVQLTSSETCVSSSTAADSVTIKVNAVPAKPVITASGATTFCPNGSVTLSSSEGASYKWSTGDNMQKVTVTQSGSYSVTVTNASGCNSPSSDPVVVTVEDKEAPVVADLPTVAAECSATVAPVNGTDNCAGTVVPTTQDPLTYTAQGTYTIHWTYDDGNGNKTKKDQTVIIKDVTKPLITCPVAPVTSCYDASGTYTIPTLSATDNCGIATTTYTITGATTRSGNSNDASGQFNKGTSTINWTVTDKAGNFATCQTTVIVNNPVTVSIGDVKVLSSGVNVNTVYVGYSPAATATLIATVSGGSAPYTYQWSTGATTASIKVSPTVTTTYTVTIRDAKGCTATATKVVKVINASCSGSKVNVCHGGNTLCINPKDVPDHLAIGDYLGACSSGNAITYAAASNRSEDREPETTLSLKASPNPSTTYFKLEVISSNVKDKIKLSVVDELGRAVETKWATAGQTIRLGDQYHPGVYFVQAIQGDQRATVKLIKQAW